MIKFPNELTIALVDECKQEIMPIIEKNQVIEIDDSGLNRIDTIGVQFILALVTCISAQKKEIRWKSTSSALHQSVKQLGIKDTILTQFFAKNNT